MIINRIKFSINTFAYHLWLDQSIPRQNAFRHAKQFRHLCIKHKRAGKIEAKRIFKECKRYA